MVPYYFPGSRKGKKSKIKLNELFTEKTISAYEWRLPDWRVFNEEEKVTNHKINEIIECIKN